MSLSGDKYDPYNPWRETSEFDWFWGILEGFIPGDPYGTGPIPMPGGVHVPDAISEEPQTWEELEALEPELFEPILETRPGHVADSYPQDVSDAVTPAQDDEDVSQHTWGDWFFNTATGLIGDFINPSDPMNINDPGTPTVGPSTPENQTATAAAMATGDCDGMTWSGGAPPKGYKVVNSCGVGVLRKVRRRRRRRMLSASDKSDIAAIVSMVGKGQMASALINRSTN